MSQYDEFGKPLPAKKGMGSGLKIFLFLVVGFGVLAVVCCGIFGYFSYRVVQTAKDAVSEDPEKIRQVTGEMAQLDMPADFEPKMSMNFEIPFTGQHVKFAIWSGPSEPEVLMLMSTNVSGSSPEEIQAEFEKAMREQGQQEEGADIQVEKYEVRKFEINGQPAEFNIGQGKDQNSDRECWKVVGSFQGQDGPVFVMLIVDRESMTEEEIVQLIESLH